MTDLRRLQYFVAVAQERNFTRAAEQLHGAQPALSRQVRLLEQEMGVELLHRTTHEFELTEAGQSLFERGPALLAAAEELWRSVRSYGTGERGGGGVRLRGQFQLLGQPSGWLRRRRHIWRSSPERPSPRHFCS